MSDYCTLDQALALIGISELRDAVAYSAGPPEVAAVTATVPSETQGEAMITAVSAEIDVHLAKSGVDGTGWSDYLAHVCTVGSAAKIAKARWPGQAGPGGDHGAAALLAAEYAGMLAFIDGGGLASATDDGTADNIGHGFADASGVAYTPQFTRDMEW